MSSLNNDVLWQRATRMCEEMEAKLQQLKKSLDIYAAGVEKGVNDEAFDAAVAYIKDAYQAKHGVNIYFAEKFGKA